MFDELLAISPWLTYSARAAIISDTLDYDAINGIFFDFSFLDGLEDTFCWFTCGDSISYIREFSLRLSFVICILNFTADL